MKAEKYVYAVTCGVLAFIANVNLLAHPQSNFETKLTTIIFASASLVFAYLGLMLK